MDLRGLRPARCAGEAMRLRPSMYRGTAKRPGARRSVHAPFRCQLCQMPSEGGIETSLKLTSCATDDFAEVFPPFDPELRRI